MFVGVATCFVLFYITAPYGRFARRGWGPTLPNNWGWVIMEAPSALVFFACYLLGTHGGSTTALVFLLMWEAHYVHRAFVYPLRLRDRGKRMPIAVAAMAFCFNLVNASLNGYYLFTLSGGYPIEWLWDPRFLSGAVLFVGGFVINRYSDRILRSLRAHEAAGYKIPHGGLYRWVSCPNYLGEIIEWTGWAVATWSLPGLAFAVWAASNLAPRAWSNHRWYHQRFREYPPERRALIPGVW
jgi:protein-S-isoprenylcysteine O-methyltransferase Ste14